MKTNSSLITNHPSPVARRPSLIFFGDDDYSLTVLKTLLTSHLSPLTIITRPPKPVGRKQILTPSPVELFAKKHHLPVIHYNKNNPQDTKYKIQNTAKTPLGVLASFGHILPKSILNSIPYGIINIHPSLLPQYRGATPVQHAIALGDQETGVTLFKLTPKIDDGKIIAQETESIFPTDTTPTLSHRLFTKGAQLLIQYLKPGYIQRKKTTEQSGEPGIALGDSPDASQRVASALAGEHSRFSEVNVTSNLIYTKKFSKDTGFVPWENFYAMMENQPLPTENLHNPLFRLRLQHKNTTSSMIHDTRYMLLDLARGLSPWPSAWTIAPSTKGPLRLKLETKLVTGHLSLVTKLAGKPNPIPWPGFKKYYLSEPTRSR